MKTKNSDLLKTNLLGAKKSEEVDFNKKWTNGHKCYNASESKVRSQSNYAYVLLRFEIGTSRIT
jgi:hypothetical protein